MKLMVNHTEYDLNIKFLSELIESLNINSKGTAIAVNELVVPKNEWETVQLSENDNITIIRATQGG